MTREDIIRMLKEAWISDAEAEMLESDWTHLSQVFYEDLEKFANIVAAAEREECAKICERRSKNYEYQPAYRDKEVEARHCAEDIRERG